MARSCRCAVARIFSISSSLLITMIWSTRSVASTYVALPSLPRLRWSASAWPIEPCATRPMVAPENSASAFSAFSLSSAVVNDAPMKFGEARNALDPAPHRIARRRLGVDAERARRHDRHQVVLREHHRGHGAVAGRQVGEPFDVAAGELVGVLHHQHVDAALGHGGAHGLPAPLEFGGGDRSDQSFGKIGHRSLMA